MCYRSHLLLNKWWSWWSKLIHIGCVAGFVCRGRVLKMVLANVDVRTAAVTLLQSRVKLLQSQLTMMYNRQVLAYYEK